MSNNNNQRMVQIPIPSISSTAESQKQIYTVSIAGELPKLQEFLRSYRHTNVSLVDLQEFLRSYRHTSVILLSRNMIVHFQSDLGGTKEPFLPKEVLPLTHSSISRLYNLRKSQEVFEFLANNIHLENIAVEAHDKVRKYFQSEKLSLEVITDTEDQNSQLVIFIHTKDSVQDATNKLDSLDRDWWLNVSSKGDIRGKLCITLEFE